MNDDDKGLFSKLREKSKKANKSKFKMMLRKVATSAIILPILKILIPILLLISVWGAITYILQLTGSSNVVDVASFKVIAETGDITETDNGQGYYFKIDKDLKERFLEELNRAFYEGYYYETEVEEPDDTGFNYDKEDSDISEKQVEDWFKTKDYEKFLMKMIRAEIASSYPKLRRLLW